VYHPGFCDVLQLSWQDAATKCCKKNMTLLAIETIEEKNCFVNDIVKCEYSTAKIQISLYALYN
jgi:hypothetical protein